MRVGPSLSLATLGLFLLGSAPACSDTETHSPDGSVTATKDVSVVIADTSAAAADAGRVAADVSQDAASGTELPALVDIASAPDFEGTGPDDGWSGFDQDASVAEEVADPDSPDDALSAADDSAQAEVVDLADGDMSADAGEDAGPDVSPVAVLVEITSPETTTVFEPELEIVLEATVTAEGIPYADLAYTVLSSLQGVLGTGSVPEGGSLSIVLPDLTAGAHLLTLTVTTMDGLQTGTAEIWVGVCTWTVPETFDTDLAGSGWQTYGDAYWDPQGWLEMTGNSGSRHGAIYNIAQTIDPGDVQIFFDIYTGGGINGGADGFAMNVIAASNVEHLESLIATAGNGGCLGYGVTGGCPGNLTINAFHIEIDTWNNQGDPIYDPTPSNHIAVTLDGHPGDHKLWAAIPSIEDQQWHTVKVVISGEHVRVSLDGALIINGQVDGLLFHGGYIGFSGTTGWASNWHGFDNLQVGEACELID